VQPVNHTVITEALMPISHYAGVLPLLFAVEGYR
jgi:hypothetical protein